MTPMVIYIGFDAKESCGFHVLSHSILTRASGPVHIVPLVQETLRKMGLYWRERSPLESTSFSLTRFLCPALCGYKGHAVFLDSDILCRIDICTLWDEIWRIPEPGPNGVLQPYPAVRVVPHDYVPRSAQKMDGKVQTSYERKNWSSVICYNAARCRQLTPDYVNTASGLDLHRFHWLKDEDIGSLPLEWNYLVGEDSQTTNPPKLIHYTNGLPCLPEYKECEHSDLWWAEYEEMRTPCQG
jgi:hypothetical protein